VAVEARGRVAPGPVFCGYPAPSPKKDSTVLKQRFMQFNIIANMYPLERAHGEQAPQKFRAHNIDCLHTEMSEVTN
jgi:hypothetical protein